MTSLPRLFPHRRGPRRTRPAWSGSSIAMAAASAAALTLACQEGGDLSIPPDLVQDRPAFGGAAALALVDTQLAFGPRVPGTAGHAAQLLWMEERLRAAADRVERQDFVHTHTQTGAELQLTNLLARFRPQAARRVLFLTHWDTRPTSDAAETPERRAMPVPGANDGGSGTAILLAAAEVLSGTPPDIGVDLLFVDGEDYGPTTADMFLGARHFASRIPEPRPLYGVLLDMVGDETPSFPIEGYSALFASDVASRVWLVAEALGYGSAFPMVVGQRISDDHIPLNEAGVKTVDVIDFDYGPGNSYWHTPEDDIDKISAATLEMVGELVLELIYMGG